MSCKHRKQRKSEKGEDGDYICIDCGMVSWDCSWIVALIFTPFIAIAVIGIISLVG